MTMIRVKVPFQGFYESIHDNAIDDELASDLENYEEECDQEGIDFIESFSMTSRKMVIYANHYLTYLSGKIESELGIDFDFKNVEVNSPKEYNFYTDTIFADIDGDVLDAIQKAVFENHLDDLTSDIHDKLEERSGFSPFYSNVLGDWPEDVKEWDAVQVEFLIRCYMKNVVGEDWEQEVINDMRANGYVSEAIHS